MKERTKQTLKIIAVIAGVLLLMAVAVIGAISIGKGSIGAENELKLNSGLDITTTEESREIRLTTYILPQSELSTISIPEGVTPYVYDEEITEESFYKKKTSLVSSAVRIEANAVGKNILSPLTWETTASENELYIDIADDTLSATVILLNPFSVSETLTVSSSLYPSVSATAEIRCTKRLESISYCYGEIEDYFNDTGAYTMPGNTAVYLNSLLGSYNDGGTSLSENISDADLFGYTGIYFTSSFKEAVQSSEVLSGYIAENLDGKLAGKTSESTGKTQLYWGFYMVFESFATRPTTLGLNDISDEVKKEFAEIVASLDGYIADLKCSVETSTYRYESSVPLIVDGALYAEYLDIDLSLNEVQF